MFVTAKTSKILTNSNGVVLEYVLHLIDWLLDLLVHFLFLLPHFGFHIFCDSLPSVFVY